MVQIEDLRFGYGRRPLFRALTLSLPPGAICGLLGKNGAGKTTLLKLLCGLRFRESGRCRVLGLDPESRPASLLGDLFFLPEEFYLPAATIRGYEKLYAPLYPRFRGEAFREALAELELEPGQRLREISYGQKKKALLAFGLASGCRLLLLDEPTNGLDIPSKKQLRILLSRCCDSDRLLLISTHQVRDMENLIDPVVILDDGRILFHESLEAVNRRLSARLEQSEPAPGEALYAEKTLGGYVVVRESPGGEETHLDLETLFNTVIGSRERIHELFPQATGKDAPGGESGGGP